MKKLTLVILAAALATTTAQAGWWRTYGGEGIDYGRCVQLTSDDNYIICGRSEGNLWLLKTDTLGNILWEHTYEEGMAWFQWVEETSDGGFITNSLLKTNTDGDSLWLKNYGIRSYCVDVTDDGGYVITGDYGADEPIALIKTDSEGDTVWTREYLIDDWQRGTGYFVRQTSDGGYILTGEVGDTFFVQTQDKKPQAYRAFLMKTDSEGNVEWSCADPLEYGSGTCVRQTDDGGYIASGTFGLLKTDAIGDTIWNRSYGFSVASVQMTTDGGCILTGSTVGGLGLLDLCLLKVDSSGDSLWSRVYGGQSNDDGQCVQQTEDGGYILVGGTSSFSGTRDLFVLKTDSLGLLSIAEEPVSDISHDWQVVFPIGRQIVLRYSNYPDGFQGTVFDACGRKVDEIRSSNLSGTLSWGSGYVPGVYFIKVQDNSNKINTAKVVLVH